MSRRPYSERAKYTVSEIMAAQLTDNQFDDFVRLCMSDAAQMRVQQWLLASKIHNCRIGVIGVVDYTNQLLARAKVMVPSRGFFMHEEPYAEFPSSHFKTKVILATGGA